MSTIPDLSWVKDFKKIRTTNEEEDFLEEEWIHYEMAQRLRDIKFPNKATKVFGVKPKYCIIRQNRAKGR